jgi:Fe-S-cluster containining protein
MQPPDVDQIEQKRIADRGFKDFCEPDESGVYWIKRKSNGSCMFLSKDNKCIVYDVRPSVCKLEPFTIVDYDYNCNLVELDLNYPFSSCCPGVGQGKTVPKEATAKATQVLINKILELTAQDMELPVTDRRVHAEVRSRILRRSVEMADLQI